MALRATCIYIAVFALCVSSASGLRLFQLAPAPGGATLAGGVASAALLGSGRSGSALIGDANSLSTIMPAVAGTAASANGNMGGSSSSNTGVTIGGAIGANNTRGNGGGNNGRNNGKKGSRKGMRPRAVWHKRLGVLPGKDVPASDCKGQSPCKICKPLDKVWKQCERIKRCKSVQWNREEECGVLKTINIDLALVVEPDDRQVVYSLAA